jgi:Patatin-like phospholipase
MKIRLFNLFLFYLFILLPLYCTKPVTAETYPNRISLAISGGASKGAYEAGLIWGLIEVLRQVEKTENWSFGGEPRPIEIASIAGTSAGGINTLLAAMVWSVKSEDKGGFTNRINDNIFRDVWLTPDVNRLLPPNADPRQYLPDDALLSREDLVEAARELRKKWRQPGTFRPGLRLPLGVTVTRVKPETMIVRGVAVDNQRFYIPFEIRTQDDGSVKFFFDPHDYPTLADPAMIIMPWPSGGSPFSISDQQVETALLTTSAFPTGFGRKRMQYCRQKTTSTDDKSTTTPSMERSDSKQKEPVCPDGYQLTEAEFADGGLFDNLPIGLARLLSESSTLHKKEPLPIKYIYLDPNRERYETPVSEDRRACEGENPPEACGELTFDLASEAVVLGGAIGTARKYELYRELTSDNWKLNLSQLAYNIADIMDADELEVECPSDLPYFDGQLKCSDRLRIAGRLLEFGYGYRITPIKAPLSPQALVQERIATKCRPSSADAEQGFVSECIIDVPRLREQLANVLTDLSVKAASQGENLKKDIRRSILSINSDRSIHVTSRGGPITGSLLGAFGAFLDYKFREFDYFVGIYDAVMIFTNVQCARNFPTQVQQAQFLTCRDRLSEELYHLLGVDDNSKGRYVHALMAKQEFGNQGGMRYAYDPMPPEDRDIRIIHEGLKKSVLADDKGKSMLEGLLLTERKFFEYLKAEGFEPTPSSEGGKSLLALIMDDPEYWSHEMVKRLTRRSVYLDKQAKAIYRAREPDPEKRDKAYTPLMGAGALALRTATYKYPKFTFSPSTAPEDWIWRNIIPYETAFDVGDGDLLLFWQPTWNFKNTNAGIRLGLGFAGGIINSTVSESREHYGILGLDLTRIVKTAFFSGWGVTPAVYHNWQKPEDEDQTTFGFDVHANLLNHRLRISLGARDVINDADDTFFLTIGIADLPGLAYWLSR